MTYRRAPSTKPKLTPTTEASLILAASTFNKSPSELLERAVLELLAKLRQEVKVTKLEAARREAQASGNPSPSPADFGLPRDYGIPPAFR